MGEAGIGAASGVACPCSALLPALVQRRPLQSLPRPQSSPPNNLTLHRPPTPNSNLPAGVVKMRRGATAKVFFHLSDFADACVLFRNYAMDIADAAKVDGWAGIGQQADGMGSRARSGVWRQPCAAGCGGHCMLTASPRLPAESHGRPQPEADAAAVRWHRRRVQQAPAGGWPGGLVAGWVRDGCTTL